MNARRCSAVLLLGALLLPLLAASAQDEKPAPAWKAKFSVDFRAGDPKNPNVRPIRDGNFNWETGGARVTMPAGEGKIPTAGVSAAFQIQGDFEITTSYEILKAEQPTEGYGVGVGIFAAVDPDALDAVSLARRVGLKGNANFVSDRMLPSGGKVEHIMRDKPAKAALGKLRIRRIGSSVQFIVADGEDGEFKPIIHDLKTKRIDVDFNPADIRYFQIGADAGDSQAAVDVRFLDLSVNADALPGLVVSPVAAKSEEPAWMKKARETNPGAPSVQPTGPSLSMWLYVALAGGGGLVFLVAVGGGVVFLLMRRKRAVRAEPEPAKKSVPRDAAALPVACAGCGKKLRVNGQAAGKRIKCPGCGNSIAVPARSPSA